MTKIASFTETELNELPTLPEGWKWARLGTLADTIQYGYTRSSTNEPIGPKFLRITDIQDNRVMWESVPYCEIDDNEKQKYSLKEGDLVFARTGATVGKSYLLKGDFPDCVFASYLIRVRLSKSMLESFVYNFFQSLIYWKQITEEQVGIGQPNVNGTKLSLLIVPVAPLPEQRAIVSRIEQLFSDLDNGIANLRLAQEQLKVYRQAVLKKAFEGELTKKWREQQTDLSDALDLLEQIRKEREEAAKASGKKVKPVKPLTEDEIMELPGLPEGWGWVKFVEFCTIQRGYDLPLKNLIEGKYPVFTSGGLAGYHNEFKAIGPCLVTGRSGSVGNIHFLEVDEYWPHNTVLYVKDFHGNYPKYVYYFFLQFDFKSFSASTAVPTLDRKMLYNELVRLPPLPEQHAIVEEIETRLSVCDKMAQDIDEALEKAEALRQSILKKAFEGKLLSERELAEVRRAEDWEPAEVLLERVRAERAGNGKK